MNGRPVPDAAKVYEYAVIDRLSNNLLGEFDNRWQAEELRHELAEANGSYRGLVIVEVERES